MPAAASAAAAAAAAAAAVVAVVAAAAVAAVVSVAADASDYSPGHEVGNDPTAAWKELDGLEVYVRGCRHPFCHRKGFLSPGLCCRA